MHPPPEAAREERVGQSSAAPASVEVVYALPEKQRVVRLTLPSEGLTAREALDRSGILGDFPEILSRPVVLGIYGSVCEPTRVLRDGDRVEVYRPLVHDPRAMRRERAAGAAPRRGRRK